MEKHQLYYSKLTFPFSIGNHNKAKVFEADFHSSQSRKLSQCHGENSMKLDIWVYPLDSWKHMESSIVIGLFFRFCLWLWQFIFHEIIRDRVTSRISVLLLILSVLFSPDYIPLRFWLCTTQTTTPLLVKTSLQSLSLGPAIVIFFKDSLISSM